MRRLVSLALLFAFCLPSDAVSEGGPSARRKAFARAAARKKAAAERDASATGRVTMLLPFDSPYAPRPLPRILILEESRLGPGSRRNARTRWASNLRVGDRIRIGTSGNLYTVWGPTDRGFKDGNPFLFVNSDTLSKRDYGDVSLEVETLFVTNGRDDDGDGHIDQGWDGKGFDKLDTDGDGLVDELTAGPPFDFNGDGVLDPNYAEMEQESWLAPDGPGRTVDAAYTIIRKARTTRRGESTP